jgi:hypothetical protein
LFIGRRELEGFFYLLFYMTPASTDTTCFASAAQERVDFQRERLDSDIKKTINSDGWLLVVRFWRVIWKNVNKRYCISGAQQVTGRRTDYEMLWWSNYEMNVHDLVKLEIYHFGGAVLYLNSWPLLAFCSLCVETFNVNTNTPVKAT